MITTFSELCKKEVINCIDGSKLGNVTDIDICIDDCRVTAIFIERHKGFFTKSEKIRIPWDKIEKIGNDVIIVNFSFSPCDNLCNDKKCGKNGFSNSL